MIVLLIGSDGSMGKRYQCILRHLRVPFLTVDKGNVNDVAKFAHQADKIILATPTDTHFRYIQVLHKFRKPILCEKPLSKSANDLSLIRDLVADGLNLTMMLQYELLDDPKSAGESYYDYFRHGNDGLTWDCLQIIGLARKDVHIKESSPVWTCKLNGKDLSLSHMDFAYIQFVKNWLAHPGADINRLIDMHHKVIGFETSN